MMTRLLPSIHDDFASVAHNSFSIESHNQPFSNRAGPPSALGDATAKVTQALSKSTPQPRLVHAAHEFEAAMMKEFMGPLASGHSSLGADSSDGDDEGSSSALTSFASDALATAISEHGGLGIAKSIIQQLSAPSNHSGKSPVPFVPNRDTLKPSRK